MLRARFSRLAALRLRCWLLSGVVLLAGCGGLLPKDWPLKQVTPPPSAKACQSLPALQAVHHYINRDNVKRCWEVAFSYDGGWPALNSQIAGQLSAISYLDVATQENAIGFFAAAGAKSPCKRGTPDVYAYAQVYSARDGSLVVALYNAPLLAKSAKLAGVPANCYVLAAYTFWGGKCKT